MESVEHKKQSYFHFGILRLSAPQPPTTPKAFPSELFDLERSGMQVQFVCVCTQPLLSAAVYLLDLQANY